MANTPSLGIDQNQGEGFIDRYWGRIPKFIHRIPEQGICEVNEDYITLLKLIIDGNMPRHNISEELYREMVAFIDIMCNPCIMTNEDAALMRAFDGNDACPPPSNYLDCDDILCCNLMFSCADDILCLTNIDEVNKG